MKFGNKKGQTMVEYIIIVVLIAITLIYLFAHFGKAVGNKVAGSTSAIDSAEGANTITAVNSINENSIKNLTPTGNFQ